MRATSSAIALLIGNLVGLGLGPTLVGFINDALEPAQGALAVRTSLLLIALAALWGAAHNLLAARSLPRDLRAKDEIST
jgi:hypothetical protein